ncbi:unnamed protein product, partial [Mesorhabditis belari]|uniref:BHLH domain-containing protein n=1 Tax=Mesorhabditis belari TaxID=2138241 RepID=A0AAF3E948_9BILA
MLSTSPLLPPGGKGCVGSRPAAAWEKTPQLVAKRNARERTRVHTVNQAFLILKCHLPSLRAHNKRVSKLKILRATIKYINTLADLVRTVSDSSRNDEIDRVEANVLLRSHTSLLRSTTLAALKSDTIVKESAPAIQSSESAFHPLNPHPAPQPAITLLDYHGYMYHPQTMSDGSIYAAPIPLSTYSFTSR